jgi:hypothetical protein
MFCLPIRNLAFVSAADGDIDDKEKKSIMDIATVLNVKGKGFEQKMPSISLHTQSLI